MLRSFLFVATKVPMLQLFVQKRIAIVGIFFIVFYLLLSYILQQRNSGDYPVFHFWRKLSFFPQIREFFQLHIVQVVYVKLLILHILHLRYEVKMDWRRKGFSIFLRKGEKLKEHFCRLKI